MKCAKCNAEVERRDMKLCKKCFSRMLRRKREHERPRKLVTLKAQSRGEA